MKKLTILIALAFFVGACHEHAHEHEVRSELKLDAGKKWPADAITRDTYAAIGKDLGAAKITDNATAQKFASAQDKRIADLLKGCTMTGEAHNQLHVLIAKTSGDVAALRSARPDQLEPAMAQLRTTVALFGKYFE